MKYAAVNVSTQGDNTIVAAVAGKRIRVVGYALSWATTNQVKFRSGLAGTDLTGQLYGVATTFAHVAPPPLEYDGPEGYFQTNTGEALVLNLSLAGAIGGHVLYDLAN